MDFKFKDKFNNLEELYNTEGNIWQYNIYRPDVIIVKGNHKPYLLNKTTGETVKTLSKINGYLKNNNFLIEN